ncbi:heavy metal sensor histidine kinase [Herbaspirillum robiniae]|uniref:heavy metal sensor histidine kinase n=1 Tax=Herbaspirillum robiniae TaxID=2014887 RepID=UPI001EDAE9C5|nr:heavy metal sensor histidine kinase [Herbaspirillum robiniae]
MKLHRPQGLQPSRHPPSMTLRLVSLFALVAIVTFAGVGSYLYHSLHVQLERRDDDELAGKSSSIGHLVQEADSLAALRENTHALLDTISGHDRLLIRITDATGATIIKSYDDPDSLPGLPADAARPSGALRTVDLPDGRARVIVSRASARSGEQATVMVARTASDRMQLLADYHSQVWYAASIGTLLATLLSYFFVRGGLRPLRLMAAQTHAISANRLDTRIDIRSAPSELHEIVESFNAMLDRLHRSFEQLTQFSADLAHDLRTPLNNLMVQTQVALGKPRALEEYQALLSSNIEEYERLSRMMESMLFLARAEHAHVALQIRRLSVEEELGRIADYFEGIAEDAGVRIAVCGAGEISADMMLLRRALGNLVANAIRYTPAQGVIRIEAARTGAATVISVANPGEGIRPELAERIFDRFYRADPSRSSAGGSSGLGLAIVRSVMTLHGGTASVSSAPGGPTVFSLAFPDQATPAAQGRPGAGGAGGAGGTN